METCILIPPSLSVVLVPSMDIGPPAITLWANEPLVPGERLQPEEGNVRLDHLDAGRQLKPNDVSTEFWADKGCVPWNGRQRYAYLLSNHVTMNCDEYNKAHSLQWLYFSDYNQWENY